MLIQARQSCWASDFDQIRGLLEVVLRGRHPLCLCRAESREFKRLLAFRDFLRNHEPAKPWNTKIAEAADQDAKVNAKQKEIRAKAFMEAILKRSEITE